ncbi:hypothetical protein C1H46_014727 [Malus baccata]|uniref:Uncharacterized protein n=1 Tax=Malus baccata TaxID=106549 RepID=A0A540MMQ8_MALBA|nr:hypothetical protein C1H46_014727 [Malus baccata]
MTTRSRSPYLITAIKPAEIMCRAPVFSLTQVFPTSPLSLCYLPLSAVSIVDFHGLHLDRWLLSFGCRLSLFYGCAREADWSWMWHLVRRCLAVEEDLDRSERSMATMEAIRSFWVLRMWSGLWA